MQLLRRSIANRHDNRRLPLRLEGTSDPKINEFHLVALGHHNIRWLEIAEDNRWCLPVQVTQHAAYLLPPTARARLCHTTRTIDSHHVPFFLQHIAQCTALDKIHHQVVLPTL